VLHSSTGAHFLQKPRVVVADDSSEMLSVVTSLLSREYSVVGRVLNGKQAVDAVLNLRPDVVVLDIQMPELDGIQAARRLQAAGSTAKVVFLTGLEDGDYISHVLNLGPYSYVFKTRCHADLPLAIAAALEGKVFCSSRQEDTNAVV
jgi:DNA-binding NarL/FixJ family response regulator